VRLIEPRDSGGTLLRGKVEQARDLVPARLEIKVTSARHRLPRILLFGFINEKWVVP